MTTTTDNRIEWIDLAKGLCMILVISGHLFWGPNHVVLPQLINLDSFLTTWEMPLFFALGGITFKTYNGFADFLRHKTNNLLIPFIVFKVMHYFFGNFGAVWFLGSLFIMNILAYIVVVLSRWVVKAVGINPRKHNIIIWAFLLLLSLACALIDHVFHLGNFVGASIVALPFFMLGYCIRQYTDFVSGDHGWNWRYIAGFLFCISMAIIVDWQFDFAEAAYIFNQYDMPLFAAYICGFAGTLAILFLTKVLNKVPLISYIGRYSIIVLLTHQMIIRLLGMVEKSVFATELDTVFWSVSYILLLLIEIPVILFCKKYLPYIFAQKQLIQRPTK